MMMELYEDTCWYVQHESKGVDVDLPEPPQ